MTEANGQGQQAPADAGQPAETTEPGGLSERVLGWIGIGFGVAILAIGIDLAFDGALSRLFGFGAVTDGADSGPG